MPRPTPWYRPLVLAALGGGALAPATAAADPSDLLISPGLVLSFAPNAQGEYDVGVGIELTVNHLFDGLPIGAGGLLQAEYLLDGRARLALGGQAFTYGAGVELAYALRLGGPSTEMLGVFAPFIGAGVVNYAARLELGDAFTFANALSMKLPLTADGELSQGLIRPTETIIEGRPLRDDDGGCVRPAVADLGPARPSALARAAAELDPAARRALAAAWLDTARDEHAAIAAFHRLARHLDARRAPPPLARAARRAAADELRHARAAFAIASALAGRRLVPVSPPVSVGPAPTLARLAAESHLDGERNEGRAAAVAAIAADGARLPAIARHLRVVAAEEAQHARLGAAIAAWAAAADPDARRALADARARPDPQPAAEAPPADPRAWRAWGRLDPQQTRAAYAAA